MARVLVVRTWPAVLLCGAAIFFLLPLPAIAGPKCAKLLQERCQSCHSLVRTCNKLGGDKESWQQSIKQMALYAPAITNSEQKALVRCLSNQEKDVVELCRQ